jgi:hypothetical protein
MASLWDILRCGGQAQVHLAQASCALLVGVIATGCALDDRALSESDPSHLGVSEGGAGDAGSSSGPAVVHQPEPIKLPVCSYSEGAVAPGCETLAANAGFSKDTDGWQQEPYSIKLEWNAGDAGGSSSSGSILVTNSMDNTIDGLAPGGGMQCLDAEPGATYAMAGDVFIPKGQGAGLIGDGPYTGQAGLSILFWRGKDCQDTQPTLGRLQSDLVEAAGVWTHVQGSGLAPEGIGSMSIRVLTIKSFKEAKFQAQFDNVLLQKR